MAAFNGRACEPQKPAVRLLGGSECYHQHLELANPVKVHDAGWIFDRLPVSATVGSGSTGNKMVNEGNHTDTNVCYLGFDAQVIL